MLRLLVASIPRAGQTEDASALHGNWTAAWDAFGWLPELFDAGVTQRHPLQRVTLVPLSSCLSVTPAYGTHIAHACCTVPQPTTCLKCAQHAGN